MKKVIIILLFVFSNNIYAQSSSILNELNVTINSLNPVQFEKYNKLLNTAMYTEIKFISVSNFQENLQNGFLNVSLPFLPCTNFNCKTSNLLYTDINNYYWHGVIDFGGNSCIEDGNFTLASVNGLYNGNITLDDGSYEMIDISNGIVAICKLDLSKINESECGAKMIKQNTQKKTRGACDNTKTRILVLYCTDATNVNSDVLGVSTTAINNLNTMWFNSNVNNTAILAGVEYINFTRTIDPTDDVNTLSNDINAQNARITYNADIVILLIGGDYNGVNGIVKAIGGGYSDAYAISSIITANSGRSTFQHEINHLYGARHDNDPDPGDAHAKCFKAKGKKRFTLLAVMPAGKSRIWHISNPNINFMNKSTGTAGTKNNAKEVNSMIATVANFRQDPPKLIDLDIIWPVIPNCQLFGTAQAIASCGTPPYTYKWETTQNGTNWSLMSGTSNFELVGVTIPPNNGVYSSQGYRVTVTDANNNSISKSNWIHVWCKVGKWQMPEEPGVNDDDLPRLSRSNNTFSSEIKVFPNPIINSINFELPLLETNKIYYQLFSTDGKKVMEKSVETRSKIIVISNIENLQKGIYLLKVTNGTKEYQKNIIIQ